MTVDALSGISWNTSSSCSRFEHGLQDTCSSTEYLFVFVDDIFDEVLGNSPSIIEGPMTLVPKIYFIGLVGLSGESR